MAPEVYLISALLLMAFTVLLFFIRHQLHQLKNTEDSTLLEWVKSTQSDIKKLQLTLTDSLQQSSQNLTTTLLRSSKDLNQRLDKAAEVISALQKEAGKFSTVSESMRDLQAFLQSPKLRGNIGEQVLKDLIGQIFPKQSFHLQYSFKSGVKVDAAIKTDAGILPIDSKFPLETFQRFIDAPDKATRATFKSEFIRSVKKHIDDISQKYILPEEGTMDFALMYLPSEPVYYEVVNETILTDYSRAKRVYPVSPTTLYAHLQIVLLSFEGKKIETQSREIFALLRAVQKDYDKVTGHISTLGSHLSNAYNKFSDVSQSFTLLGQKISSTSHLTPKPETPQLE